MQESKSQLEHCTIRTSKEVNIMKRDRGSRGFRVYPPKCITDLNARELPSAATAYKYMK